ncbi:hypothetical protein GSI_05180 [Ganoderma sinense ZZ0214-1]|uniref:Fungal-type protein kinase domain-containing protein n=1 Tax=Ganoderma sinense ZZ0214-1 TaxID=1077348 RepID=A0A2G8SFK1_9APHY|nr:hypothetical protein GSI_05180 [Ganoderma sinense ZZ0214-1]
MTKPPHFSTGTPISNTNRTRYQESLFSDPDREKLDQRRRKFADDMAHAAVPANKDEFCKAFFPAPTDPAVLEQKLKLTENPFAALLEANKLLEADVRRLFTKAVNDHNLVPGFKMRECGERPDPSSLDGDKQKVDAALYHAEHAPTDGRQAWPDQMIPIEFKRDDNNLDPWDDSKPNISSEAIERKKGRGQCISYSELLYAVQHRVALFMLVVVGTRARFVRWDRSGTIVTRSFDYVQDWEFFCDILWRISLCSDAQLGLDPTATRLRPGDADYDRMTEAADLKAHADDVDEKERDLESGEIPADDCVYKYVRKMFSESVLSPWPRYRVEVPAGKEDKEDKDSKATRQFLIAKPTFRARGMSGRGTRGYVALDCQTGKFVWLKDAWRAHYLLVDKEGDVLRRLNKAGVKHVPTLICHGDVEDQVTLTPDWWETKNPRSSPKSKPHCPAPQSPPSSNPRTSSTCTSSSSSTSRKRKCDDESRTEDCAIGYSQFREDCPLRLHKHYRLVEKEVAMPLSNFTDGQQLASLVLDCIYAHYHAYTKPSNPVLHRDVSGGNLLILPKVVKDARGAAAIKWTGLLADWEMSKPKDYKGHGRQPERTGTWQFLSVALLSGPKEVELCDELEAFFYVLLYYGVRYLHSNLDETAVGTWLSSFFDTYGVKGDTYICGNEKMAAIKSGTLVVASTDSTFVEFDSPMDHLLTNFLRWFRANHIVTQYQHERRRLKLQPAPETTTLAQLPDDSQLGDSSEPMRQLRPDQDFAEFDSDSEDEDGDGRSLIKFGRTIVQPSNEEWALHKKVLKHKAMVKLLQTTIAATPEGCKPWRRNDKVGDRVDKDFRPPVLAGGPTLPATLASNKRQKVDGPAFAVSMPLLTAARPPKTPERKQPFIPPYVTGYAKQKQH